MKYLLFVFILFFTACSSKQQIPEKQENKTTLSQNKKQNLQEKNKIQNHKPNKKIIQKTKSKSKQQIPEKQENKTTLSQNEKQNLQEKNKIQNHKPNKKIIQKTKNKIKVEEQKNSKNIRINKKTSEKTLKKKQEIGESKVKSIIDGKMGIVELNNKTYFLKENKNSLIEEKVYFVSKIDINCIYLKREEKDIKLCRN